MQDLFNNLGIDWKLLLSQGVNFGLLLIALRVFAYKPLLSLIKERRERIEKGLAYADEAEKKLGEASETARAKVREAEAEGLSILRKTEEEGRLLEEKLIEKAREKETALLKEAGEKARAKEEEARAAFNREAEELVKMAIVKTVELSPENIDKALVAKAVAEVTGSGKKASSKN